MISILIPIYNGIEFFRESLLSVLLQKYDKWELIVGINGDINNLKKAKDIYNETLTLYYNNYPYKIFDINIKFYETKGKQNTLNKMIDDIKYEYVALLDVDDVWTNEKLYKQIPYLEKFDVVGSLINYFGNMSGSPNLPVEDITNFNFLENNPLINSTVIIKKEDAYWNPECFVDDYDMWLRLKIVKNRTFYNVPEKLCYHRIHPNSFFNNTNHLYVEDLKNQWKKYNK